MKDAISNEGRAIIEFFNLQNSDIEKIDLHSEGETLIADVELKDEHPKCKYCGMDRIRLKERVIKTITHSNAAGRPCKIHYHAHRYKCLCCSRTYLEENPFVFKKQKITVLTITNILEDMKSPNETFSNVGKRYHLSPTTVASIFDYHVKMERLPMPEYMCIDESYSFKSENSNYVCMFIDFMTGAPIDILPSRREEELREYFSRIPLEERCRVRIVGMDMWKTYRRIVKEYFPRAYCSADHYHIKQDMHRKIDRIRIKVMKRYDKDSKEYHLLKSFHWMIFKNSKSVDKDGIPLFDPKRPGKYNRKYKKDLNYYDILELIKEIDPELNEAIILKEKCNAFYENSTYDTALDNLKVLIKEFRSASSEDMVAFGNTMAEWRAEIINSFIVIDNEYSVNPEDGHMVPRKICVNQAKMERANSSVKTIKKVTMAMGNWERFRNRVLYALREDANYRLNPIDTPRARKKYKANNFGKTK